jgi:hypothetical protein
VTGSFPDTGRKSHEQISLDHFKAIYRTLDPAEISRRCALPCDTAAFALRFMGNEYRAAFPDFELRDRGGRALQGAMENILFLRYLCQGKYTEAGGRQLSYREIPWGEHYYPAFESRCIKRFARTFGTDLERFKRIMEGGAGLRPQRLDKGEPQGQPVHGAARHPISHLGYRFEFSSGLYISFLLWAADEEFPPSAQILFDDNIPAAFTAEDAAVVCEVAINRLSKMSC